MISLPMAPAERAVRLTGREYLSFSSISLYQSCPLKWFFRYVVDLPETVVSSSLVFGRAIHRSLQHHFEGLLANGRQPSLDSLIDAYQAEWQDNGNASVAFNKGENMASLSNLAAKMLDAFQKCDLADPSGQILAVEEELTGEVVDGCPPLLARLDLAIETPNALVITDFKTARNRWTRDQAEDAATQLLLYQELAQSFAGDKPVQLQFAVLTKTKEPAVELHPVNCDRQAIDRTRRIVESVWQAIDAELFYPAPSAMQCPGCPYRVECRAWPG